MSHKKPRDQTNTKNSVGSSTLTYSFMNPTILSADLSLTSKAISPSL